MSFKAINDSIDPNGLISILPVFGAYPRMTELDTLSLLITHYIMAMKKAIDKIRKCIASWQINDALNTCNRLSTASVHDLSINLLILVYQEGNAG